ncbi:MAG: prepilin-type N-terminal cleavage/methylation domain-containing protein [Proteobacteria bacterium]|nr:prepilin-type N-terminal cleavage/methylation domain-containing protein [Pseudomonadota bacterium]
MNIKLKKSQRGVTLLELMVFVGVFALFSMMAYGTLNRVLDQSNQIEQKREYWRALSLTFLRMEEDMAQARARPVRDIDGTTLPSLRGLFPSRAHSAKCWHSSFSGSAMCTCGITTSPNLRVIASP